MESATGAFVRINSFFKKAKQTSLLVLFFTQPLFGTEQIELQREDETPLYAYYDGPEEKPFSLFLFIPSCQKKTVASLHETLRTRLGDRLSNQNFALITLEKPGIQKDGQIDEKEYEQRNALTQRIEDHTLLLRKLAEGLLPKWNGKWAILGQGEGGRIGANLSAHSPSPPLALITLGAGGAWPVMEEAIHNFRTEMIEQRFSAKYIQGFVSLARKEFKQILENPTPKLKAFGFSYKYWESLLKTDLLQDLLSTPCPIYCIQGDKDDRVPFESVETLAEKLHQKSHFSLLRKTGAGRKLIHDPNTYDEAFAWLEKEISNRQ